MIRGILGAFGYRTELELFDVFGLVDREVARLPTPEGRRDLAGHTKMVEPVFFFPRRPTYLQSLLLDAAPAADLELAILPESFRFGLVERNDRHRLSETQELLLTRLVPLSDELEVLLPVLDAARGMVPSLPEGLAEELERRLPASSESVEHIRDWIQGLSVHNGEPRREDARADGVAPHEQPEIAWRIQVWSRVRGRPWTNVHQGAIALAIRMTGHPTLNGRAPGWIVIPKDSESVWSVEGGSMAMITLKPAN